MLRIKKHGLLKVFCRPSDRAWLRLSRREKIMLQWQKLLPWVVAEESIEIKGLDLGNGVILKAEDVVDSHAKRLQTRNSSESLSPALRALAPDWRHSPTWRRTWLINRPMHAQPTSSAATCNGRWKQPQTADWCAAHWASSQPPRSICRCGSHPGLWRSCWVL